MLPIVPLNTLITSFVGLVTGRSTKAFPYPATMIRFAIGLAIPPILDM